MSLGPSSLQERLHTRRSWEVSLVECSSVLIMQFRSATPGILLSRHPFAELVSLCSEQIRILWIKLQADISTDSLSSDIPAFESLTTRVTLLGHIALTTIASIFPPTSCTQLTLVKIEKYRMPLNLALDLLYPYSSPLTYSLLLRCEGPISCCSGATHKNLHILRLKAVFIARCTFHRSMLSLSPEKHGHRSPHIDQRNRLVPWFGDWVLL
jgi:hypothetical protein